ncbi:hypothetical protein Barb6XT_03234 [Bacteroidales bacterium Barb6XT]|nr:hypothetical protein Barb6XT_03234 [Bacteroidales bacterium Barb6XT]
MFSEEYRCKNNHLKTVNWDVITDLKKESQERIDNLGNNSDKIHFFFAIMETEAWLLGIKDIVLSINSQLTNEFIKNSPLGYDLDKDDPQQTYYHPAKVIGEIFGLAGKEYDKKESTLSSLIAPVEKEKYEALRSSAHCSVFSKFIEVLLN